MDYFTTEAVSTLAESTATAVVSTTVESTAVESVAVAEPLPLPPHATNVAAYCENCDYFFHFCLFMFN